MFLRLSYVLIGLSSFLFVFFLIPAFGSPCFWLAFVRLSRTAHGTHGLLPIQKSLLNNFVKSEKTHGCASVPLLSFDVSRWSLAGEGFTQIHPQISHKPAKMIAFTSFSTLMCDKARNPIKFKEHPRLSEQKPEEPRTRKPTSGERRHHRTL